MSVLPHNIKFYGSATMKDDDSAGPIGGAIDKTKKVQFGRLTSGSSITLNIVSDDATDTTPTITVTGRNSAGTVQSETDTLNGTTPVAVAQTWDRILKATTSVACAGTAAVINATATHSGTAIAAANGTASEGPYIDLAATASATDDAYNGMVIRTTGTVHEIREIIDYDGTNKRAYVNEDWGTLPSTDAYAIHEGVVFDKGPTTIREVRRIHYDASANPSGGATKDYYEKLFVSNEHTTLTLSNAKLAEVAGGVSSLVDFGVESTLNDTNTNGATNDRLTLGTIGVTFASTQVTLGASGDGNLPAGSAQGFWTRLRLTGGTAANESFWTPEVTGQST